MTSPDETLAPIGAQDAQKDNRMECPDAVLELMLRRGLSDWYLDDGRKVWVMAMEEAPRNPLSHALNR